MKEIFTKGKVLIPYFTYGDPEPGFTEELVRKSFDAGADIVEIGIPFSDPIADGPVIQASHFRALSNNPDICLDNALDMVASVKRDYTKPIIFMAAANLIFSYGIEKFFINATKKSLSGLIVPDLSIDYADNYLKYARKYKVKMIFLVSPLTKKDRLKKIVSKSDSFIYLISTTGTTGEREKLGEGLQKVVQAIKAIKDIPVAVGFGISKKEHVHNVFSIADGAIVGSLFVRIIEENLKSKNKAVGLVCEKIREFKLSQIQI